MGLSITTKKEYIEQGGTEKDYNALIEKLISIDKDKEYWIVGYGSILNKRSRSRTTEDNVISIPAYIEGYERIYDLDCTDYSVLNVREKEGEKLGVVACKMNYTDYFNFLVREQKYDLVTVPVFDWKTGELVTKSATMVVAKSQWVNQDLLPLMSYVQANMFGVHELGGAEMLNNYLETTKYYSPTEKKVVPIGNFLTIDMIKHFKLKDSTY